MAPVIDPNFVQTQQKIVAYKGAKMAKKANPVSTKKMLLIIVPVIAVLLAFALFLIYCV